MTSISDVMMMIWEFVWTQVWQFDLFGKHWEMTILQIWIFPCIAFITIRIIKHIYEVVSM